MKSIYPGTGDPNVRLGSGGVCPPGRVRMRHQRTCPLQPDQRTSLDYQAPKTWRNIYSQVLVSNTWRKVYLVFRSDGKDRRSVQEQYYHGFLGRHTSNAKHITQPETGVITAANPT
jgi:hypothetical protein